MRTCSVDGCTRPHKAYGWCGTHYMQWRRHGTGTPTKIRVRPPCSIEGCGKRHFGHGYCQMHYSRQQKYGDPHHVERHMNDPAANFWQKAAVGGDSECWPWRGALDGAGYGSFSAGGGRGGIGAHRWIYEHTVGPIAPEQDLDHLCHTRDKSCAGGKSCPHRRCVNPAHLEPVTPLENWSRGRSMTVANRDKTHCKNGHEFTPENTYTYGNRTGRSCRICAARASAEYRARKRTAT